MARNAYPGTCLRCGCPVGAYEGHFERHKGDHRWKVRCCGCVGRGHGRPAGSVATLRVTWASNSGKTHYDSVVHFEETAVVDPRTRTFDFDTLAWTCTGTTNSLLDEKVDRTLYGEDPETIKGLLDAKRLSYEWEYHAPKP